MKKDVLSPEERALVTKRFNQMKAERAAKSRLEKAKKTVADSTRPLLPWMVMCVEFECFAPKRLSHADLAKFASKNAKVKVSPAMVRDMRNREDYQEMLRMSTQSRDVFIREQLQSIHIPKALELYRKSLDEANRRLDELPDDERAALDLAKNMPLVNPALERAAPKKQDSSNHGVVISVNFSPQQASAFELNQEVIETSYEVLPTDDDPTDEDGLYED